MQIIGHSSSPHATGVQHVRVMKTQRDHRTLDRREQRGTKVGHEKSMSGSREFKRQGDLIWSSLVRALTVQISYHASTVWERAYERTAKTPRNARQSAIEVKREAPTFYETFVQSGHYEVNDFEMYYEIHGAGNPSPLLTKGRQLIAVETSGYRGSTNNTRPLSFIEIADMIFLTTISPTHLFVY
jgi:hypothetical protein